MKNTEDVTASTPESGSVVKAEIEVIARATATREQVNKACHEAAYQHFGKEGEGTIHLTGLALKKSEGFINTYLLSAELRRPLNAPGERNGAENPKL